MLPFMKNALITGASRGLGLAIAKELGARGHRVVMVARNEAELALAVKEVPNGHGLAFDVGDKLAIHKIAGAAAGIVGPINVLVHCASTLGPLPMPLLLDLACEDFEDLLQVNLVGPFRLTKAIASSMLLREEGTVLFASSDAATSAYPGWGAYGVSKAAQDHLAKSFAAEVPGVRFFSVDPGEMDTRMHASAMPEADRSTLADPADVARRFLTILRRGAELENGARLLARDFEASR
jgi:NAD(P)-dependent dehydrogenase (short-subunit alcohol dehydrogenase family)